VWYISPFNFISHAEPEPVKGLLVCSLVGAAEFLFENKTFTIMMMFCCNNNNNNVDDVAFY